MEKTITYKMELSVFDVNSGFYPNSSKPFYFLEITKDGEHLHTREGTDKDEVCALGLELLSKQCESLDNMLEN